ncbi:hypothetical protein OAR10_01000 [Candidatus Pelagibacter sp.]|nr:hypothetical protein [Candidatus Pelagibacter sp.]
MKKLLGIVVLGLLWCNNSIADPDNPTSEWLETQSVKTLTQEYDYNLNSIQGGNDRVIYTLTHFHKGKLIVISCIAELNPKARSSDCFLP